LSKVLSAPSEGTFQMKITARRPKVTVSADGTGIVSQAGAVLLTQTLRATGLDRGLSAALERWRPGRAVHDPGKVLTDLAVALALGGDCCSGWWLLTRWCPGWSPGSQPMHPGH
jgi:Transposase DDE domain group 1